MADELPDTFTEEGVEFETTKEAKKDVIEIAFIREPDRGAELDDSVRIQILQILREGIPDKITTTTKDEETGDTITRQRDIVRKALSVVEIVKMAKECKGCDEITKNQVYHHLPKLIEHSFVIKYGTATKGKRTTDYYRRTAMGFLVTTGVLSTDAEMAEKKLTKFVDSLGDAFDINLTDDEKRELAGLWLKLFKLQAESRSKVVNLLKRDVADRGVLKMYETLLDVYAFGSDEVVEVYRKIRKIIFSGE